MEMFLASVETDSADDDDFFPESMLHLSSTLPLLSLQPSSSKSTQDCHNSFASHNITFSTNL
jgi:hypothetical protein